MDLKDFIENGATIKNPNYKKPSKSNPTGSPRFIISDNLEDAYDNGTRIGKVLAEESYDLTHLNTGNEKWEEYGVHINPINTEEELQKERANNQSALEQAGNSIVQAVGNEVVLGTFLGLSNIVDAAANVISDKTDNDYTNPFSTWIEGLQEDIRNRFEIYEKDPNASWSIGDFGWWANNAVSIASTASMLIPSTGIIKGISTIGKIGNIGSKTAMLAARAAKAVSGTTNSTARLAKSIELGTEIGSTAFLSRTMENYLEARGVYTDIYDSTLKRINEMSDEDKQNMIKRNPQLKDKSNEEIAKYIAGESADRTFANDYAMLLMDIAQFKAISNLWKGTINKTATSALRSENKQAIKSLVGETADNVARTSTKSSWLTNRIDRIKEGLKHPLTTAGTIEWTEGIEEGYQGIQTEKGKEVAEMIINPEFTPRTIESYLTDAEIWEQAFWGVLGGMGFQAVGKGLGNLYRKGEAIYKHKRGKLSDEDFATNMTAEEKIRASEINGRAAINKKFIDDMKLLNDLKSPDEYKEDPITGERIKEDGVDINKSITPEEAEIKKAKLVNDYVSTMAMNAIDTGNYDLLKEYVSSPEFDKYFKDAGLELNIGDKEFTQQMIERMDEVANNYQTNLYNILKNTDVDNDSVARIAAREITREQLAINELIERKNLLQEKIDNNIKNIDFSLLYSYRTKATVDYVKKQLANIDRVEQSMYEDYRNNNITEQAKNQYEKDYDNRRRSLIKFLNDNNHFIGDYSNEIKSLYKNINNYSKDINSDFYKTIDILESIIEYDKANNLPKSIAELIDKQINIGDALSYQEFILPKNQKDFIDRIAETEQQVDKLAKKRLDDAAKQVEDYIKSQDDLIKATNDVMSGNVAELKNALDILKIGYYTTDAYTKSIMATIREEQSKRIKQQEAEREIIIDGKKGTSQQAQEIRNNINEINNAAENNKNKNDDNTINVPSTGEETQLAQQKQQNEQSQSQQSSQTSSRINIEEDAAKAAISKEDIERFDKSAIADAAKIAEAFKMNIDDEAVGRASTIAFNIYKTSRNIFDDALGKDIDSPEVQRLINMIITDLEEQGVSVGFAPAAAKRGAKLALAQISRTLSRKKDSKADQFRTLADSIAAKIDMTNGMAAITKSLNNTELNAIIDKLLDTYKEYKDIATPKGQKVIINLERLFNDIIYNKEIGIDIDTAMHILYNMRDYITNPLNTKYEFTHKRSLNTILKNPIEFFNSVTNARLEEVQLDNYMHISSSTKRTEEYEKLIAGLNGGEDVEIEYLSDRYDNKNSISFKVNGKEIGFISTVTPNSTNTGYKVFISKYSGGIAYNITKNEKNYSSNTDSLFNAIFDNNDILWDIVNKQHRHNINSANRAITDEEISKFMNHPAIKKAIKNGVIVLPKKWSEKTKKVIDKYITDKYKAQFIINAIEGVVFFNPYVQTKIEYRNSYKQWIQNAFTNYKNTHKIQTSLDNNRKIITKFAGLANTFGVESTDVKSIIDDTEHGISEIGLTSDRNPIVGVVSTEGNTMLINEKTGKTVISNAPFKIGSMGMLIGGRENTPILAMFTSANKLGDKIKKQLKDELTDIFTGFQQNKYTYEEVDKKLSSLFNGPGINNPTIFQGYSVVHNGNSLALSIGGQLKQYVLIINKFKKGTTEIGTGISYAPNGEREKSKSSISVDKKFINNIVNEIVDNVVYNRTFYTLNNIGKDNTSDNPYMYKENGKFIINLGGIKTSYNSFGDFVLQENAFNTNQGRNSQGGYFDNTDKVNSLYVDISVLEVPSSKPSPINGEYKSIADTIKTATTNKYNSSKELLEKATIPQDEINFLSGDNIYDISLIPEEYGYDNKLTREYAIFRNGKILFGNAGANYANTSPFTLKRLLIHENLHDKFNKQNLFAREGLVNDLFDTYNATIEAIENIIQNYNEDSSEYKNAIIVRKWFEDNKFNPNDYFTQFNTEKNAQYAAMSEEERRRIFAEEWLVETLTQPTIMNFLNNVEYRGEEISVEGIESNKKTIWQKIIDLLLKLFGKGRTNIKNNTIFAKQYLILGNIDNNVDNTKSDINEQTITDKDAGIDTTKNIEDSVEVSQDQFDEELGLIDDDTNESEESKEDIEDIDLDDEIELDAITTSAEEYILDHVANDGGATAETFGVTRITNMADYLNMFAEQDKPLIAKMLENGELKYACR